jgi:hypothetical protein
MGRYSQFLPAVTHKAYTKALSDFEFSTGNVISDAQLSMHIRAWNETECNGFTFEQGHMQQSDLKPFAHLPYHVRKIVYQKLKTQSGWLYEVRHSVRRDGKLNRVTHGWILMDKHNNEILFRTFGNSEKSESCIARAVKAIELEAIHSNTMRAENAFGEVLVSAIMRAGGNFEEGATA